MVMSTLEKMKRIDFKYYVYALNAVLFGFAYILFQKRYFSIGESLLSPFRIIMFLAVTSCFFLVFVICSYGDNHNKFEKIVSKIGVHPMSTVMCFTALFRVWYLSHFNSYVIYYDSKTYTKYTANIFKGETDIFRTPGYPYFIKFISLITGQEAGTIEFYEMLSLVQCILSLMSVAILYLACRKLFSNKYILSACALVFGIAPSVFTWDIITLTESLSLFLTVVLIYILFSYLAKPKLYIAIVLGLFSFAMIMVRPTFIYLTAVLMVFFIARIIFNAEDRKRAIAGLLSVILCIGMVFGYQGLNYKNHDYFAISSVSTTVNKLFIVMSHGWTDSEKYPFLSNYLEEQMDSYDIERWIPDVIEILPMNFPYETIDGYVNDCLDSHSKKYQKYILNKIKGLASEKIATQYTPIPEESENFSVISPIMVKCTFPFTFMDCMMLVLMGVAWSVLVLVMKKRICWHIIGLCAITFSHIFVSVLGSMAEFSRLSSMVIPVVMILVFYMIDYVVRAAKLKKVFCLNDNNSSAINFKTKKEGE